MHKLMNPEHHTFNFHEWQVHLEMHGFLAWLVAVLSILRLVRFKAWATTTQEIIGEDGEQWQSVKGISGWSQPGA